MSFELGWEDLPYDIVISTPLERTVVVSRVARRCEIQVGREILHGDLIVMAIKDYDLILDMDWLSKHGARVDCRDKRVQFVRHGRIVLEYQTNKVKERKFLIAGAKVRKM
jgi:hypothetical protein